VTPVEDRPGRPSVYTDTSCIGKTTLLNLIMGKLKPLKGTVSINAALRIGHFTQHSADNFDLKLSAVENLLNIFEEAEDQEIRSFLGKFQIQGNDALKPMMLLSGGQKSRVAFATLAYKKPHVLVSKFHLPTRSFVFVCLLANVAIAASS
jgi:ATPase subunit of ABC transporter with duplicated ATPase domains